MYEDVKLPRTEAGAATIRLDFCTPEIFRLRFAPGDGVPDSSMPYLGEGEAPSNTPMVVGEFDEPVAVRVREDEAAVMIETSSLHVRLQKQPWRILVYAAGNVGPGKEIFSSRGSKIPAHRIAQTDVVWDPSWNFYLRYGYSLGVARRDGEASQVFDSFDLGYDEHIYGFGERYLPLDKRGQQVQLWQQEVYSNTSSGAYKNIPFYISSKGYGLFINTSYPITARVGDLSSVACSIIVDRCLALDTYFIYGPTIKEILPRYHAITGQPGLPPKWTFGHWMSRITYSSQEEVEQTAEDLRAYRIPTDVIHIDTGWFKTIGNNDLRFDPVRFPDPKAMAEKLHKLGFHLSLWQTTNVAAGNQLHQELEEVGGMARRANEAVYNRPGYAEDCGLIDYSNPKTIELLTRRFRELFDMGISVIKVDFGEGSPVDGVFYAYDGYAMRNLYALIYNRAIFKMTEDYYGEGNGVIWARSTWAGSQRYPLHWSGDGVARWEDLAGTLRSGLSFGLSGFVFWSHDIGGFTCVPSEELYARWVQLGAFSSHSRAHGEPPREPWKVGKTAEAVYRQYMELRYRLLPYIYSQGVECVNQGLPMLRALVIDFQDDPTAAFIDDQYLFGDSFLVAPIMTPTGQRRVYLPPGEWIDYWTKESISGSQWLDVDVPLERLPLWVRAGAIIPMGPLQQYVGEKALDPLTVELYAPGEEGKFVIHDQGKDDMRVAYGREDSTLTVEIDPTPGQVELVCYGIQVHRATINDKMIEVNAGRVAFDGQAGALVTLTID